MSVRLGAALLTLGTMLLGSAICQADFFVAPNGDDAWSGTLAEPNDEKTDGPLASLEAARDAVRRLKEAEPRQGPIRVVVRGGTYRLTEPIVLEPQDSGAKESPILYTAAPGERPVISGGVAIGPWTKQPDGPLWTTVVPAVRQGTWYFRQLFVDGRRATPARTPNDGFLRSAGPGKPYTDRSAARSDSSVKTSIQYENDDLQPWDNLGDAVVIVYHSWTASRHRIESLDTDAHRVRFTAPSGWPMGYWEKNQRYYVEFVREALDEPGEWYLDRRSGLLTYYPRDGEDMTQVEAVAPVAEELLRLDGDPAGGQFVEHVRFEGLTFAHTAWTMPEAATVDGQAAANLDIAAVACRGARNCEFRRCEISHTSGYALWFRHGCKDNRAVQCQLHDLGAGGVRLGETSLPGDEPSQAERNTIENCFIHDGGHVYHAGIGVWIGRSSHNLVRHNDICDFLYTGVSVGWSWGYAPSTAHHNVVEYNHIHHLGWGQLSDMGAIYCLGLAPGTVLRNNHMHDVLSYNYGGWGLYTDEGSTGILMENNLVYRVKDGAFHQHYGRDNLLRNNVLALSATYGQIRRSREEEHNSFTLERNIIYSAGAPLLGGQWANGNFTLLSNCYFDTTNAAPPFPGGLSLEAWQAAGHDADSVLADPGFLDPDGCDFRLAEDSPALELGFQPIDMSTVGLTGPDEWVDLPKRVERPEMVLPSP